MAFVYFEFFFGKISCLASPEPDHIWLSIIGEIVKDKNRITAPRYNIAFDTIILNFVKIRDYDKARKLKKISKKNSKNKLNKSQILSILTQNKHFFRLGDTTF